MPVAPNAYTRESFTVGVARGPRPTVAPRPAELRPILGRDDKRLSRGFVPVTRRPASGCPVIGSPGFRRRLPTVLEMWNHVAREFLDPKHDQQSAHAAGDESDDREP